MRLTGAASLLIVLCLAAAAPGSAERQPTVSGPPSVSPGHVVSFRARGFRPGSLLEVVLAPAGKASCCAVRIPSSFPVSALGDASLSFKMPGFYRRCLATGHCRKIRWSRSQRLSVTAFGYLQEATTRASIALSAK